MSYPAILFLRARHGASRWRRAIAVAASLVALSTAVAAPAESTFIVFHSPQNDGQALGPKPNPPALGIAIGATRTLRLYVENFEPTGVVSSGTDENEVSRACVDGTGDEMCGWLLQLSARGMRIESFTQGAGGSAVAMLGPNGESLKVTGGSASGELGPVSVGTLRVTALAPNASLELSGGSWLDAAGAPLQPAVQVLALSFDSCGNGSVEPPEECDDGNASSGDGCFSTCRIEDGFALAGSAQGGTIDVSLAEKATPLVATTIAGESAGVVAARVAMLIEDDAELSAAGRSAVAFSGTQVVTDATLQDATSNDPGLELTLLPEPSAGVALLAGMLALSALAIRRRMPAP